jgi:hypothetical protein
MRRLHLFELEDLDWVPRPVRDGGTDLLDLAFDRLSFYRDVAPAFLRFLEATRAERVVDLCSGGGGGALQMRRHARAAGLNVPFLLSDLHPNQAGAARVKALGDPSTTYMREPANAMSDGVDLKGLRTMSGALHHFRPAAVTELVRGMVERRQPFFFLDVAASDAIRRMPAFAAPLAMLPNLAVLFVVSLVLTPLIRPVRFSRLILTYMAPLIPTLVAWDGTVSALRAYTSDELLALARAVPGSESYRFEAATGGRALYLAGAPR